MKIDISRLAPDDLGAVDGLMKRYSQWLGFLPREALQNYLEKGTVLGATTDDGQLVGYLLYADRYDYFRITHLCVLKEYQCQGIARRLVNDLKEIADTQKAIKLNCRRDFPANNLWHKLGFVALDEKPGRSKEGHLLTIWHFMLAPEEQLQLFQAETSDETLDIIIDAQIFFDFYESDSEKTKPSKALLADFLVDSLNLWITDELFNEIHRNNDPERREEARHKANNFFQVETDPNLVEGFDKLLREFLPSHKPSQESDIRQLAKAAASNVDTFVTRDRNLLKKSREIADCTGLEVLDPVNLIIQLHELSERQSYSPNRIVGLSLCWNRLESTDLASLPFDSFLEYQETKGKFRQKLDALIAQPNRYECELLQSGNEIIAIRVLTNSSNEMLTTPLARVAFSANRSLFGRFLIADTVSKAAEKNLDMVKFEASALTSSLIPDLLEMGFIKYSDNFVRFCFSRCFSRQKILSAISKLCLESITNYENMSSLELERCCSPLDLAGTNQRYFLIPIRPGYAMSLIDRQQSANDLFGGNPHVLLRWDNVYYRKVNRHKMIKAPGRILWYVSSPSKQVIAVSHLDEVVIDTPKELFRRFKKFGILEWNDLYKMCDHNPLKELMALRFSHTFLFREPISLEVLRSVFKAHAVGLSLQSPLKLSPKVFHALFQKGYPN